MATPSVAMIPSGYKDGTLYNVLPNNATGDFDVTRGSLATRVNKEGLIEPVGTLGADVVLNGDFEELGADQILNGDFSQEGSEEITNGDFATDSDWAKNSNWTISGGTANCDGTSDGSFFQSNAIQDSKQYLVTYTISNLTQGALNINLSGTAGVSRTSNGTYTEYIASGTNVSGRVSFDCGLNPIGSIDNVSVVEVGQDWILGTGWSFGDDKATHTGAQSLIGQSNILTIGKNYKITFDLSGADSSNYARLLTSQYPNGGNYTSDGTITVYTSTTIDPIFLYMVLEI